MIFEYSHWDPNTLPDLKDQDFLQALFNYLLLRFDGDSEKALEIMRQLQQEGRIKSDLDLEAFEDSLRENNLINGNQGNSKLSPKGERSLRQNAFEEIFKKLKSSGSGSHQSSHGMSNSKEILPETRAYSSGDDPSLINYRSSIFNNIAKKGNFDLQLHENDLEVHETMSGTGCATVLMIDISHSMILYGEDRITPAKQVALAFTQLILTKYPKDDLNVVLFGDDATEVPLKELPYINVGPYHTNTQAGLKLARNILLRKKQPNKQIFMITDGKPSMMKLPNGELYKNSVGLDPMIINSTYNEAIYCRKKGIEISTFMLTQDPTLVDFVERLTELCQGRAFYSSIDNLGSFILRSFVTNRKRFFH